MKVFSLKKMLVLLALLMFVTAGSAFAGFIDFENGADGGVIFSNIPGLEFTNTAGYSWLFGDWRTNGYNGCFPNYSIIYDFFWPRPLATQFFSDGNFFAWMGSDQGIGVITFTQSYATYFQVGYSVSTGISMAAYDEYGLQLDLDAGVYNNQGTGQMDYLRVEAPGMAYVTLSGNNNNWLIDNLETDAIQQCTVDLHCDDSVYCNGEEKCVQWMCEDGEPVVCEDDGLYCNGDETCDEETQACVSGGLTCEDDGLFCNGTESCSEAELGCASSGDPCAPLFCDEQNDECTQDEPDPEPDMSDDDDSPEEEGSDEEMWPKGEVTGGCGC